ncbi:hypothetical protein PG999_013200 [Apiospora kogelbergensis]|uniref:Major facilitator superfamily (MFS) profile domain-containing protein n=1 Tax=Apiospora kogelbergensis TaxID=1337665 RepID=A0AAW0QBJ1_9PEZI
MTVIGVVVPQITTELGSLSDVGWYGSAYFLAAAASQLAFGALNRVVPHKYVYTVGVFIFELGCLISGLATSSKMCIVGRAISGLGSSGIVSTSLVLVTNIVPPKRLPFMIGALGSLELVGQITGPLIGGGFATNVSWRWCFLINVPLGVVAGLTVFLLLRGSKQAPWSDILTGLRTIDAVGILLTIPGSAAILFVIQSGGNTFAWDSPTIIGLAVAGGVLLVILFFWERSRGDLAVLPFKLFRNRNVVFGATFAVGVNMAVSLFDYFVPFWNETIRGISPERAGILLLPLVSCSAFAVIAGGSLATYLGRTNPVMIIGGALVIAVSVLLSSINASASESRVLGYSALAGISALATQQPYLCGKDLSPTAISLMLFSGMSGSAVGLAMAQAIFINQLHDNLDPVEGINVAAIIGSGATELRNVVPTDKLEQVLKLYNLSLVQVFYVSVGAGCLMLASGCLVSWRRTENDDSDRLLHEESADSTQNVQKTQENEKNQSKAETNALTVTPTSH